MLAALMVTLLPWIWPVTPSAGAPLLKAPADVMLTAPPACICPPAFCTEGPEMVRSPPAEMMPVLAPPLAPAEV